GGHARGRGNDGHGAQASKPGGDLPAASTGHLFTRLSPRTVGPVTRSDFRSTYARAGAFAGTRDPIVSIAGDALSARLAAFPGRDFSGRSKVVPNFAPGVVPIHPTDRGCAVILPVGSLQEVRDEPHAARRHHPRV